MNMYPRETKPQTSNRKRMSRFPSASSKSKDVEKKIKDKTPTDLGPEDITIHTRSEGPTVQLCGDRNVARKWISGEFPEFPELTSVTDAVVFTYNFRCGYRKVLCTSRTVT